MPTSTNFRIRAVAGASFAVAEGVMFDIHDLTNDLVCVYNYLGVSWSVGTPGSVTFRGPWNNFRTRSPMSVQAFGGIATSAGASDVETGITVFEIQPIFGPAVTFRNFQSGFTAGVSFIGAGIGSFSLMFPAVPASRAPFPHNVS